MEWIEEADGAFRGGGVNENTYHRARSTSTCAGASAGDSAAADASS